MSPLFKELKLRNKLSNHRTWSWGKLISWNLIDIVHICLVDKKVIFYWILPLISCYLCYRMSIMVSYKIYYQLYPIGMLYFLNAVLLQWIRIFDKHWHRLFFSVITQGTRTWQKKWAWFLNFGWFKTRILWFTTNVRWFPTFTQKCIFAHLSVGDACKVKWLIIHCVLYS